jgi:hypothetical protein
MESQALADLTSLLPWPAGYVMLWAGRIEEINLIDQCFLVFMMYWICCKVLFLDESPEGQGHLLQSIYY